jgi:Tetratricopeptide repeat
MHRNAPPTLPLSLCLPEDGGCSSGEEGDVLQRAGHLEPSEQAYLRDLARRPDDVRLLINYGSLLCSLGRYQRAHDVLIRAIRLAPDLPEGWGNLGCALIYMQRYQDAVAVLHSCLQRQPALPFAFGNLGVALDRLGRHEMAQTFHREAIRMLPDDARRHSNYAISLLAHGDYLNGFREYEWRWTTLEMRAHRPTTPQWRGERFDQKTVLIHTEGGFGDMIQFSRFIPLAVRRGGRVVTRVRKELLPLFRESFPDLTFVTEDAPVPPHDLHCSVLSLPYALGVTMQSIPAASGFLRADPRKVLQWKARLGEDLSRRAGASPALRIGLVWAGAPHRGVREYEQIDRRRSTDLATFAPFSAVSPDILFYSLQIGNKADQANRPPAGMTLIDHTDLLHDFGDTAALVANLDLVIAVDTSTVHLAAGLGRPVWMLSRFDQCWRWLSGRMDSPWYDSLRVCRQSRPDDWSGPVRDIATALHALMAARPAALRQGRLS